MTSVSVIAECDVLIVGAGIVGLAHAAEAQRRGLSVLVIDRDSRAVGASVRNFGHCCITAQSGDLLELAHVARERWLHFSDRAGFFAVQSGALAVARSAEELAVLEELAGTRETGEVRLIAASEARLLLDDDRETSGFRVPEIVGGAVLRDDLRVDPRQAVGALAGFLSASDDIDILWRTSYLGRDGELAETSRGLVRAARTIVCVGHDLDYLYPETADTFGMVRCALQMALIEAPAGRRIAPAVLTGTSMLRYPAFAGTAAAGELAAVMNAEHPELIEIGANVMFTQRPDGSIIAGDSHHYDVTTEPFTAEATTDVLLRNISQVLGIDGARVIERWQGVYASSPKQDFIIAEVEPGVTAVSITSGVGMTISFGVAVRTLDSLT